MEDVQAVTTTMFATQSRSMAYNSGAFISDGQACLIDPGPHPEDVERLILFVARQRAEITTIILTHSHWDHLLGPERMRRELIITSEAYRALTSRDGEQIIKRIMAWETEWGYTRAKPFVLPQPDATFVDATELPIGKLNLTLLAIPGHAADQIAIYEPRSGALWAADTLSDLEIPFIEHSLAAYEQSLSRLAQLAIRALVPGHGAPTTDRTEIVARLNADRAYLAELRQRVTQALERGLHLEETQEHCGTMVFREPAANAEPHRENVRWAYAELRG
jgi:glyoxylase-like metal-dependent hydrolase (beta-lactamase superfamily II)